MHFNMRLQKDKAKARGYILPLDFPSTVYVCIYQTSSRLHKILLMSLSHKKSWKMYQQPAKDNRASDKNDGDSLLLDSFILKQT